MPASKGQSSMHLIATVNSAYISTDDAAGPRTALRPRNGWGASTAHGRSHHCSATATTCRQPSVTVDPTPTDGSNTFRTGVRPGAGQSSIRRRRQTSEQSACAQATLNSFLRKPGTAVEPGSRTGAGSAESWTGCTCVASVKCLPKTDGHINAPAGIRARATHALSG